MPLAEPIARNNSLTERDPIEINKFWMTRSGDACITRIIFFKGKPFLDIRRNFTGPDGRFTATKKGIALSLRKIRDLRTALEKAEREAGELGLLKCNDGSAE